MKSTTRLELTRELFTLTCFDDVLAVEEIKTGLSHLCFMVKTKSACYFAKYFHPSSSSAKHEIALTLQASLTGLAPRVHFQSVNWLISAFVPSIPLSSANISLENKIALATKLMNDCHQLKVELPKLALDNVIESLINTEYFTTKQQLFFRSLLADVLPCHTPENLVTVHGDVNFSNILYAKKAYLVDFECACKAEIEFDLAMFIAINLLNEHSVDLLVKYYRKHNKQLINIDNKKVMRYLLCCYLINGLWCFSRGSRDKNNKLVQLAKQQFSCVDHVLGTTDYIINQMR